MMKWLVCFCVALFWAGSFAADADISNNNKKSNKGAARSGNTPADHNVLHALQKFFTGKDSATHPSPTSGHRRKATKRSAEGAAPANSPEPKASSEATPSPTARRVVLPESSAKPAVSPTPVSSAESNASPTPIVTPVSSPSKEDVAPKGD
jgi:hypothetical protein